MWLLLGTILGMNKLRAGRPRFFFVFFLRVSAWYSNSTLSLLVEKSSSSHIGVFEFVALSNVDNSTQSLTWYIWATATRSSIYYCALHCTFHCAFHCALNSNSSLKEGMFRDINIESQFLFFAEKFVLYARITNSIS